MDSSERHEPVPFVDEPDAPSYQEILDMEADEAISSRERERQELDRMSIPDLLYWIAIRKGGPEEYDGRLDGARAILEGKRERREYWLRWGYIGAVIVGSGSLAVIIQQIIG
jgi:hypothetical protein